MTSIQAKSYTPTPPQKIAFVGLGVMGFPMAGHLAQAGHSVTVYNRNANKAVQWLKEFPGASAPTPREAAQGADIVFVCVGNDDDLRAVLLGSSATKNDTKNKGNVISGIAGSDGALAGMHPGAIVVDHTTASAQVAREIHAYAQNLGVEFIDAPVSGGQMGAIKGMLTVMCGGEARFFNQVQPTIAAYAQAVTLLGTVGAGQLAKMVNQICIAGVVQGLAEAISFGEKAGLPMDAVLAVISKGAAQSWQMENRGKTMIADQFDFGFAVNWMRKDLGLVLDEARRNQARLPLTALVDQFYADLQASGAGRMDTSSLIRRLR